jgi:ketosteroid isomerase-like protein
MADLGPAPPNPVEFLDAFGEAWNRHDVDAIMTFFCEGHCVFSPGWGGERFEGRERVRQGVAAVFARFPDARFSGTRHFVCGNRAVSEWTLSATGPDGSRVELVGCDIYTFNDGKILVKDAYRKTPAA